VNPKPAPMHVITYIIIGLLALCVLLLLREGLSDWSSQRYVRRANPQPQAGSEEGFNPGARAPLSRPSAKPRGRSAA
jgi:hypothetical protein